MSWWFVSLTGSCAPINTATSFLYGSSHSLAAPSQIVTEIEKADLVTWETCEMPLEHKHDLTCNDPHLLRLCLGPAMFLNICDFSIFWGLKWTAQDYCGLGVVAVLPLTICRWIFSRAQSTAGSSPRWLRLQIRAAVRFFVKDVTNRGCAIHRPDLPYFNWVKLDVWQSINVLVLPYFNQIDPIFNWIWIPSSRLVTPRACPTLRQLLVLTLNL